VACGFHAGDAVTARGTLRLAAAHGVRVGAHPGYADRENFGRRELDLPADRILDECLYQIGALAALARAEGLKLGYVKPHGALYNQACRDEAVARPVVEAAAFFGLPLLGLPGSRLGAAAAGRVPFVAEGFADRRYQPDGSLVPRSRPDAFVTDPAEAAAQAERLLERGVRTLCVHGDNPQAVAFLRELRAALRRRGVVPRPF
jgi:5-oxoprolinase (ATP-hydrolysing) subunit A